MRGFQLKQKAHRLVSFSEYGAPGRIRTSDRSVRSRVLYPAELLAQSGANFEGLLFNCQSHFSTQDPRLIVDAECKILIWMA